MAMIRALEGRTVHQIQSGQVIVDLCSVAKELVENSLDSGATSIEVRFKNHGLDSIEVQDNGSGISAENYETIALKHYTSKLSSYDDLTSLQTFGFRGEALSSLCALSDFHVITARQDEAPKGTRLDFEVSGKLSKSSVIASLKGTTVSVANLFSKLPVRRRELEKHIKREYSKVLAILQAYACISTGVKLSASNEMTKGKKPVVFSTRGNQSTRDNLANIYGAKALTNLLDMDLNLAMEPTSTALNNAGPQDEQFRLVGHVSRPVFGEGRQAPDRQMFFVNSRPCNLPQLARVFNDVYKSFNVAQSPFVFANIQLDANAYDVNVSPDKRTILLHDQSNLFEAIRSRLVELFNSQEQTVPQSQLPSARLPSFKPLTVHRQPFSAGVDDDADSSSQSSAQGLRGEERTLGEDSQPSQKAGGSRPSLIEKFASRGTVERNDPGGSKSPVEDQHEGLSKSKRRVVRNLLKEDSRSKEMDEFEDARGVAESDAIRDSTTKMVADFNARLAEQARAHQEATPPSEDTVDREAAYGSDEQQNNAYPTSSIVQNAFDRMRPRCRSPEVATVTIGSKTTTSILGSSVYSQRKDDHASSRSPKPHSGINNSEQQVRSSMQAFAAPGSGPIMTVGPTRSKARPAKPQQSHDELSSDESARAASESHHEDASDRETGGAAEDSENEDIPVDGSDSDAEYVDEDEKKIREEARVDQLIKDAQEAAAIPSEQSLRRATSALKGSSARESTLNLVQNIDISLASIESQLQILTESFDKVYHDQYDSNLVPKGLAGHESQNAEQETDSVTLTVTKEDFSHLRIIGQFNLGFILASRRNKDLFIIDQHASDEKINFERLQSTSVMQNQRLVQPRRLELTAVDEEIILENEDALLRNGFVVEVDQSGDYPVGQRVSLVSLPMSKETTFTSSDFEELVALLGESPGLSSSSTVPRPSRTRKLFAMRACRSSVMIGKVMTMPMMAKLVRKMGEIDKPWNCPHGRPTMRHVCGLDGVFERESGLFDVEDDDPIDWAAWMEETKSQEDHTLSPSLLSDAEEESSDD